MAVRVERNGTLGCYGALNADPNRRVRYLDFNPRETKWIHISCIYDWRNRRVRGTLFSNNMNYAYFDDQLREASILSGQDYRIFLNTDPLILGSNGSRSLAFTDFRFWRTARSLRDL